MSGLRRAAVGLLVSSQLIFLLPVCYRSATRFDDQPATNFAIAAAATKAPEMSAAEIAARRSVGKLMKEGLYDEAVIRAKAVSIQFNCPEFYFNNLGAVCLKRCNYQGAVDAYEASLRVVPNNLSVETARNRSLAYVGMMSFTSLWSDTDSKLRDVERRLAKSKQVYWLYYVAEEYLKEHPEDQRIMVFLASQSYGSILYQNLMTRIDPHVRDDKPLLEAETLVRSGAMKEVLPVITQVLHRRKSGFAYALLATALASRKRKDEARRAIAKAIAYAPDTPRIDTAEGICLMLEKKYEEAIKRFDRYLEIDPNDSVAMNKKIEALLLLGREREASALMEKGGLGKIGTPKFLLSLHNYYGGVFKMKEALRCLDLAIELEPKNPLHYYRRADDEAALWLFQESLADCNIALKLNPQYTEAKKLKQKCEQEIARANGPIEKGLKGLTTVAGLAGDRKFQQGTNESRGIKSSSK
ncbi:MAG: tetratricopeptide repeat protein [Candidatus Obscuribacterales bacterium]|nr:tetratricopeptide repeat protein [Candidatus Obscuribacterales bacterium]